METLAYLHCASACEELPPVEPIIGEDETLLFDGVVNWKKFSSLALLGLLPLTVAFGVMGTPSPAEAGHCHSRCGHHRPHYHKKLVKKVVYKKIVYYYRVKYKKRYHCYRPKPVCHHYRPKCHRYH